MSQDGSGGPNPFSREGSTPEDALGSRPTGAEPTRDPAPTPDLVPEPYPAYPYEPYPAEPPAPEPYPTSPYAPSPYATNPYAPNPYAPGYAGSAYGLGSPYGVAPQHPQAVTALVLSIVGLVVCPPVGIGGLVVGLRVRRESDAHPGQFTGRGLGTAAIVLGIISIVVMVFWIVLFGGVIASDY